MVATVFLPYSPPLTYPTFIRFYCLHAVKEGRRGSVWHFACSAFRLPSPFPLYLTVTRTVFITPFVAGHWCWFT